MKEKTRKSVKEILIAVTLVLVMDWMEEIQKFTIDWQRLVEGKSFSIMWYFPLLAVGGLWILLFICSAKENRKEKLEMWRERLVIVTLICILQWMPVIPSFLGSVNEFFWKSSGSVIFAGYLLVLAIVWAVFFIGDYIRKKRGAGQEEEKLKQIKDRIVRITFVIALQYMILCLNLARGLVLLGYPLLLTMMWIVFRIGSSAEERKSCHME